MRLFYTSYIVLFCHESDCGREKAVEAGFASNYAVCSAMSQVVRAVFVSEQWVS